MGSPTGLLLTSHLAFAWLWVHTGFNSESSAVCMCVSEPRWILVKRPMGRLTSPTMMWWRWKWNLVAHWCLTLCEYMDCSPPGSPIHGILQARTLEWVAISFSMASSQHRDQTQVSCIAGRFFTVWSTREAWGCPLLFWPWRSRSAPVWSGRSPWLWEWEISSSFISYLFLYLLSSLSCCLSPTSPPFFFFFFEKLAVASACKSQPPCHHTWGLEKSEPAQLKSFLSSWQVFSFLLFFSCSYFILFHSAELIGNKTE